MIEMGTKVFLSEDNPKFVEVVDDFCELVDDLKGKAVAIGPVVRASLLQRGVVRLAVLVLVGVGHNDDEATAEYWRTVNSVLYTQAVFGGLSIITSMSS